MLDENNKNQLILLYDNLDKMINDIIMNTDNSDWDGLKNSIELKEKLINKIVAFERPYVSDIKANESLFLKRKELLKKEQETIEYIKTKRNQALSDLGILRKKRKIMQAYEPDSFKLNSTIEVEE